MATSPKNWIATSVGSVTLPVFKINQSECPDDVIRYVDISGIDNTNYRIRDYKEYVVKEAPSRARQIIKSGDVLFSTVRPYLKNIAQVTDQYNGEIASTGFSVLRPATGIEPKYLYFYSTYRDFINSLSEDQYGVSYPAVKDDQVREKLIPLPPEKEQHRIVTKIEELFSELDKGIESLKTAREQLKIYRQALLKQAFEGKLTEQWRKDNADKLETADQLLERIKLEREARYQQQLEDWKEAVKQWEVDGREGKKPGKPKKTISVDINGLIKQPSLPPSWAVASLGNIGIWTGGGTPSKSVESYWRQGNTLWVTPKDMKTRRIQDTIAKITLHGVNESSAKIISYKSILFVVRSGILRRVLPVSTAKDGVTINQDMQALSPYCYNVQFLYWYCISNDYQIRQNCAKDGTTVESIDVKALKSYPCPVLGRMEQDRIVSKIEEKMSVIDDLEVTITSQLQKSESLRQSILKKAFSGQLVAQDPNDRPANVLLERIDAEKTKAATKLKQTKTAKKKQKAQKPTANVLPFKTKLQGISTTDLHAGVLALAYQCYEHSEKSSRYFRHVKGEKIAHLIEAHLGIDLGRTPVKDAAGPNDYPHLVRKVEPRAKKAGYFEVKKEKYGHKIYPLAKFPELVDKTQKALGNHLADVEFLLVLMKPLNTRQSEIVATLYAAWNNLLLDGLQSDDEAIVKEAREDWHKDKLRIERDKFFKGLAWMRKQGLVPAGKGEKVCSKQGGKP